jgi:sucrose phosphorylase
MVYNFALPPLVLHTFYTQDATALSKWARELQPPSLTTSFFNFLDSHDGVGLMAVKEILTREEIDFIIEKAKEHGGLISYKTGRDGQDEPYEVNITWFSALNPGRPDEDLSIQIKRFVASRAIAMVLKGVPGIYLLSLFGTENDIRGVTASGSKRAINRKVMSYQAVCNELDNPNSKISLIERELGHIIAIRTEQNAFHPNGDQQILDLSPQVFALLRISPQGRQRILCLINVAGRVSRVEVTLEDIRSGEDLWMDLVTGNEYMAEDGKLSLALNPYDVLWLTPVSPSR